MCLIGVITGEFLTSKSGIGYSVSYPQIPQKENQKRTISGIRLKPLWTEPP